MRRSRSREAARALAALFAVCLTACGTTAMSGASEQTPDPARCAYWQSKVDRAMTLQGERLDELPAGADAGTAIRCLLLLRGRTEPARFSGVTRFDVSQQPEPATVEIAALYYITFIYEQSWQHGDAVMLVGPGGTNRKRDVRKAFDAVERWLQNVDRLGIAEVRARRLHPLAGTSLSWYGRAPVR